MCCAALRCDAFVSQPSLQSILSLLVIPLSLVFLSPLTRPRESLSTESVGQPANSILASSVISHEGRARVVRRAVREQHTRCKPHTVSFSLPPVASHPQERGRRPQDAPSCPTPRNSSLPSVPKATDQVSPRPGEQPTLRGMPCCRPADGLRVLLPQEGREGRRQRLQTEATCP